MPFSAQASRAVDGCTEIIPKLNTDCMVISVDMPSGLFGEDNSNNNPEAIVRADITLPFNPLACIPVF